MYCRRCGAWTPRLSADQTHCPTCDREVKALIAADARRRVIRVPAKDFSGWRSL